MAPSPLVVHVDLDTNVMKRQATWVRYVLEAIIVQVDPILVNTSVKLEHTQEVSLVSSTRQNI